ncbi:MAG TPA: glycosyltransferase family 2 protein [bacterium]|nr:glycosyltransferase family 2 protein [bacterium]HPP86230.1 glycosyltransferase family 2 protein [bacterium]
MKILIIVPAYNEEASIEYVIKQIKNQKIENCQIDIAVINDCSQDKTSEIAKAHNVIVIDLINNLGIGGAVQTGYIYAFENNYDIAVQIDGDGQHNPEYLKSLLDPIISNNCDIAIGSRFINKNNPAYRSSFLRRIGIKILANVLSLLTSQKITDATSGFRAANKKVIRLFAENYPDDYPEPETFVILYKNNLKILEVSVKMNERYGGKSSINAIDSIYYMIKVLIAIFIDFFKGK